LSQGLALLHTLWDDTVRLNRILNLNRMLNLNRILNLNRMLNLNRILNLNRMLNLKAFRLQRIRRGGATTDGRNGH